MSFYETAVERLQYGYRDFWDSHGSECVNDLPLLAGGPWKVLVIVGIYLWFVKWKGPEMMKNREPYHIKPYVIAHNVFLVLLHLILYPLGLWSTDFGYSCWECKRIDIHHPVHGHKEYMALMLGYVYFLTKFFELADTVFFVLRKKQAHVSTLHVFHHASMPIFCYLAAKFSTWHTVGWVAMLNAFVHIVMYSYYTLAALGVQRWLWLKKYITQLQIFQFVLILIHAMYFLQKQNCGWPMIFRVMQFGHGLQFLYMFSSFYVRTYWKKPSHNASALNVPSNTNGVSNSALNGDKTNAVCGNGNLKTNDIVNGNGIGNDVIANGLMNDLPTKALKQE